MPSSLAHTVTGAALAYLHTRAPRNPFLKEYRLPILGVLILANLADLDFIPHMLASIRVHHTFTHSIVFTLLVCLTIATIIQLRKGTGFGTAFALSLMVYGSHVILDMFGGGRGVTLLWPLSSEFFRMPVQIFPNVNHSEGLLDSSHLRFLAFESAYSAVVTTLVILAKRLMTPDR